MKINTKQLTENLLDLFGNTGISKSEFRAIRAQIIELSREELDKFTDVDEKLDDEFVFDETGEMAKDIIKSLGDEIFNPDIDAETITDMRNELDDILSDFLASAAFSILEA